MAKKRLRFSNAAEIRKSLARVSNAVLNDELDVRKANCIVTACNVMLSAIRTIELEDRIREIEDLLDD